MKQAVLITAYHNLDNLNRIVNYFDKSFNIYIHIDLKSNLDYFNNNSNVFVYSKFNVNWGGRRHVDAILFLCEQALKEHENRRFHLVSGDDYPILPIEQFKSFFTENEGVNFIEYFSLPNDRWSDNGGLGRLEYYHPLDRLNIKNPSEYDIYSRFMSIQKKTGKKRALPIMSLFGGSTWWSLNRDCIEYIVENKSLNNLYESLEDTFVPEEIFIPTLILNSPLVSTISNNNLRYISWRFKNNNIPAVLDEYDLFDISQKKCFFIRKVDSQISQKLIGQIYRNNLFYRNIDKNTLLDDEKLLFSLYSHLNQEYNHIYSDDLYYGKLGVLLSLFVYEKLYSSKRGISIQTAKRFIKILEVYNSYSLDILFELGAILVSLRNNGLCHLNIDALSQQLNELAGTIIVKRELQEVFFPVLMYAKVQNLKCIQTYDFNPLYEKIGEFQNKRTVEIRQLTSIHCPYGILGYAGIMLILMSRAHKDINIKDLFICAEINAYKRYN